MTNNSFFSSARNQPVCACCDANASAHEPTISSADRDIIQDQAGNVLITLGSMFANTPAFKEHIDSSTAAMLVSLGKKLKKRN